MIKDHKIGIFCVTAFFVVMLSSCMPDKQRCAYKNETLPIEVRIEDLLDKMTMDEKLAQLSSDAMNTPDNNRLGIPGFRIIYALPGVYDHRSTIFPIPMGLAASWDTTLVVEVGKAIAREASQMGYNCLLADWLNISRIPGVGTSINSMGEDPFLIGELASCMMYAMQKEGVLPIAGDFICHNQEYSKSALSVIIDEHALQQIYLTPFRKLTQKVSLLAIVTANHGINNSICWQNKHLLQEILRNDWQFKGITVSIPDSCTSFDVSTDIALGKTDELSVLQNNRLRNAYKAGEITDEMVNDRVRRILRIKYATGMIDNYQTHKNKVDYVEAHTQLAYTAALKSFVLLKNSNEILPFDRAKFQSVAVIGQIAESILTTGSGVYNLYPTHEITPLEALQTTAGYQTEINYAKGYNLQKSEFNPIDSLYLMSITDSSQNYGLYGEYYDNIGFWGETAYESLDKTIDFDYIDQAPNYWLPSDSCSVRWTGVLKPPVSRKYILYLKADDICRLFINEKLAINLQSSNYQKTKSLSVFLNKDSTYRIRLEYTDMKGNAAVHLGWDFSTVIDEQQLLNQAIKTAKSSDAVILFAGFNSFYENREFDRKESMELPANQTKLINAIVDANPNTIVIINSASAVKINSWSAKTRAIIQSFYPGMEGGDALAKILFGYESPSGKLPFSYYDDYDQCPAYESYKSKDNKALYTEGIFVGYSYLDKKVMTPAFPFGHGLTYATFEYNNLRVDTLQNGDFIITFKLSNTGRYAVEEISQLYVRKLQSKVVRAEKELKAFTRVAVQPADNRTIKMIVGRSALGYFDATTNSWKIESGTYEFMIGCSARDIRLRKQIVIR